jgi:hypothetical protein
VRLLHFIEDHKTGILGTLLLHFVLLVGFNYVQVQTYVVKDPVIVMDFSEPILPPEVRKNDPLNPPLETGESPESNTAKNEAAPQSMSRADYNQLKDQLSESGKASVDEKIYDDLKALEQQVINEQRAAGYGYTEEQAKELIESFKSEELEHVKPQEARSEGAYQGTTNISYKLENRYDTYIYVPVYLCQNGGKVTVNLAVNQEGEVVKAKVDGSGSLTTDPCLLDAALKGAYRCKFNRSNSAPALQRGSITFIFSAQ